MGSFLQSNDPPLRSFFCGLTVSVDLNLVFSGNSCFLYLIKIDSSQQDSNHLTGPTLVAVAIAEMVILLNYVKIIIIKGKKN